jgi:hypothetical protein
MLVILFLVSLFRGDGKNPSVVGVTKCKAADNVLLAILIVSGLVELIVGSYWIN